MKTVYSCALGAAMATSALAAALVSGTGYAAGTHATVVKRVNITEVNNRYLYAPKKLTIKAGTRVIWTNRSDAPHTVTAQGGSLNKTFGKDIGPAKTVQITFTKKGTFKYFCTIHPYMKATVIVH